MGHPKKRIGFDMSEKSVAQMDELMQKLGLETRKDLFNHAMTLLDWVCEEIEKGNAPMVEKKDGTRERLLMPAFKNLQKDEDDKKAVSISLTPVKI